MPRRTAGPIKRLAALAGGLLLLAMGMVISIGIVLVAPVAMGGATIVQRWRGRRLTRVGGMIAAGVSVVAAVALAAGLIGAAMPRDTWSKVQHAADSASVASARKPPPAWVTRLVPGAGALPAQSGAGAPRMSTPMLAWGGAIALAMFALTYAAMGWGGAMLIGLAFAGHWPGAPAAGDADASEA